MGNREREGKAILNEGRRLTSLGVCKNCVSCVCNEVSRPSFWSSWPFKQVSTKDRSGCGLAKGIWLLLKDTQKSEMTMYLCNKIQAKLVNTCGCSMCNSYSQKKIWISPTNSSFVVNQDIILAKIEKKKKDESFTFYKSLLEILIHAQWKGVQNDAEG